MPERQPYHHGNLRATLLIAAERTLRDRGIEQVTLRDLARQAGVSHGAPSRHFRDRQALLDALAAEGYERLADEIVSAIESADDDFEARLRAAGMAYVRFAVDNASLLDLMSVAKETKTPGRPYVILTELIRQGHTTGELHPGDPERLQVIILATIQGIAALVSSGQVAVDQADALVADAITLFTR